LTSGEEFRVIKSYWLKYFISLTVIFAVDYLIASFFADGNQNDTWIYFAILIFVPILFAIKSSIVRVVLWYFMERKESIDNLVELFSSHSWPTPNWNYQDGKDYLQDVMYNNDLSDDIRIEAAQMYGVQSALAGTQQIMASLMSNNILINAIRRYEKLSNKNLDI
jgi:hypothetical protein